MDASQNGEPAPDNAMPEAESDGSEVVEFIWSKNKKLQRVEIRTPTWGRLKESQRGLRIREFERAEVDPETGEERTTTIREYDAQSMASRPEQFFRVFVVSINGHLWTAGKTVDSLDPSWVNEFLREAAPRAGSVLEEGRKKSPSQ